jgi:hypothetical protein
MRRQILAGKFPTNRPPNPKNGKPRHLAEGKRGAREEQLQSTASRTYPSSPLPTTFTTAKIASAPSCRAAGSNPPIRALKTNAVGSAS